MKTIVVFALALLAIVAMSGCIDNDDDANGVWNVTDGAASNDTNMTLAKVDDRLNDNESEVVTVPALDPEPKVEVTPIEPDDPNITIEMNETVNLSGLSVACTMVKDAHHYTKGTDWSPEVNVRNIKLYVTINVTGDYEIETGLEDWWILDERGRRYQTTPHTDVNPMKPVHKLSDGDTVNAYLLFDLSGNVADFVVQ